MGFGEESSGDQAAGSGQGGDGQDGTAQADDVRGDAGDQGADGVAAVSPEAVDADGGRPPAGVGDIPDGGEQGRVDEGGADPERRRPRSPKRPLR